MAKQKLLSSMFPVITKEVMEEHVERDMATLSSQLEMDQGVKEDVQKRPVGRPKKVAEAILLTTKVEKSHHCTPKSRVRGPYMNWFIPSLWDPIYAAVNRHRNLQGALRYLQFKFKLPGETKSVYDRLQRSTMVEWFTPTGELKEGTKQSIFKETTAFTGGIQHTYVLANHSDLEEDIITLLKEHRDVGQPLFATFVRGLIRTMIEKRAPTLLENKSQSGFKVSLAWTRDFVRTNLNWSFRKSTGSARKLPKDWEEQGLLMAQRAAYLVKAHSIPPELMVNTDQTGIHLIPIGGTRTWAEKGSKHVLVHGQDDKRQITVSVSSSAVGNLLPFQAIFTSTTHRCLPPQNEGSELCEEAGWHLTYSGNHWSNLDTCKDFVKKILEPYRVK
jgi:hypothetical protein